MTNRDNSLRGVRLDAESFRLWAVVCIIWWAVGLLTGWRAVLASAAAVSFLLILLMLPRPPYIGPHQ